MIADNTRLNSAIRAQAIRKVLAHSFTERLRELIQFRESVALMAYYGKFNPDQRRLIEVMPDDWKQENKGIQVILDGERHYLPFNGQLWDSNMTVAALLPRPGYKSMVLPHGFKDPTFSKISEVGKAIELANQTQATLEEDYVTARKQTEAVFRSFSTIGKLKEAWPDIIPFLPETIPHLTVQLPAVIPANLNGLLRLPA